MSAIYTFEDELDTFHVYKHFDGHPTGAAEFIEKAKNKAWPLPGFDASDFAAAFIAANKDQPGDIRMSNGNIGWEEYVYEITSRNGNLHVVAHRVCDERTLPFILPPLYDGPQSGFAAWAEAYQKRKY